MEEQSSHSSCADAIKNHLQSIPGWEDVACVKTSKTVIVKKHFNLLQDNIIFSYVLEYNESAPEKQALFCVSNDYKTRYKIANKSIAYRHGFDEGVRKKQVKIVPVEAPVASFAVSYETVRGVDAEDVENTDHCDSADGGDAGGAGGADSGGAGGADSGGAGGADSGGAGGAGGGGAGGAGGGGAGGASSAMPYAVLSRSLGSTTVALAGDSKKRSLQMSQETEPTLKKRGPGWSKNME